MYKAVFLGLAHNMNPFNRSKNHPDRTVLVTVTITGKLVPTVYALILSVLSTTLAVVLTEGKPPVVVKDASYPTLPHQIPPQNPICVAHLI
jgi:hypothetical protein